jgi:nucleoside-diphosphate-sugar epimerase
MKRTTVLLTGSDGFLGNTLVARLLKSPVSLVLPTRRQTAFESAGQDNVRRVYTADLFAEPHASLDELLAGVDIVIHAAWNIGSDHYHSLDNLHSMAGSLALAQAAVRSKVRKFVGIGSAIEYGLQTSPIPSSSATNPTNLYAASKVSTYLLQKELFSNASIDFAWIRLFNLYGASEDPSRLFRYVHEQIQSGRRVEPGPADVVRDYLDVAEAADQVATIALGDMVGALNVCSGNGKSIREIAEAIADQYGRRDLLQFGARTPASLVPQELVGVPSLSGLTLATPSTVGTRGRSALARDR